MDRHSHLRSPGLRPLTYPRAAQGGGGRQAFDCSQPVQREASFAGFASLLERSTAKRSGSPTRKPLAYLPKLHAQAGEVNTGPAGMNLP